MIGLVVGFLVEVVCEAWYWAKLLAACAALLVPPVALAYLAYVRISALPSGRQLPWAVAAIALGVCVWRVWRRRATRFLANKLFGED